jgi:putative transposase
MIDEYDCQTLGVEVATSTLSTRVIAPMEQLLETHGNPSALRMENGAEFTAHAFTEWCEERSVDLYLHLS